MIITSRTLRALGFATCVAVTASSLAACGGHKGKATVETTSSSPAPVSTSASTTATPPPVADVNPLTGGKPNNNPVIAVKIDDASVAIPQVGIDQADIVYVEQVEGGLTRLIAVYNSKKPETVGPVRSVRSNDPQLLNQYGPIAIVASGGGGDSLPTLDGSILKSDINDRGGPGFFRDGSRVAPHNLMFSLAANPGHWTAKAKSIGFVWDASTASLKGTPAGAALHTIVGASSVDFTYNARYQEYIRVIGGVQQKAADGNWVATPNVIVQFCQGHVNPNDVDAAGNPGHFTQTIGHGKVVVYRNGHKIIGTWTRFHEGNPTVLKDSSGKTIPLAPGGAWVVLVDQTAPLS